VGYETSFSPLFRRRLGVVLFVVLDECLLSRADLFNNYRLWHTATPVPTQDSAGTPLYASIFYPHRDLNYEDGLNLLSFIFKALRRLSFVS
jgi:hypothetical protein